MAVFGEEIQSSPRDRVKFICSHGGKILPRPLDGQLKYVGGETRIIAVSRNITFSELMNKLSSLFNSEVVLKYQLVPEDLDTLVSVTCDEDLTTMFDEFLLQHHATRSRDGRSPRMRAFLFPSTPITMDIIPHNANGMDPNGGLDQCYIEAINGIVRTKSDLGHLIYNYSISSPGSSQNSSNSAADGSDSSSRYRPSPELQRVQSSPNLLSSGHQQSRLRRPGNILLTAQSDIARYNKDQLASRYYCTPVRHMMGTNDLIGFGQANGPSVMNGGGVDEGELTSQRNMTQRWGSPLKPASSRQD